MNGLQQGLLQTLAGTVNYHQRLFARGRDQRCHQTTTYGQLRQPGLGKGFAAGRGNDGGVWRPLGKAGHAVAKQQMHIGQPERPQQIAGALVQPPQPLDAVDLGRQMAQHGGLVAAASANFQHTAEFARPALAQQLQHARHHAGLGDGLAQAYRQAGVFISLGAQAGIDKAVPLHRSQCLQHGGIRDPAGLEPRHHGLARCDQGLTVGMRWRLVDGTSCLRHCAVDGHRPGCIRQADGAGRGTLWRGRCCRQTRLARRRLGTRAIQLNRKTRPLRHGGGALPSHDAQGANCD